MDGLYVLEKPIRNTGDDLGVPPFQETSICFTIALTWFQNMAIQNWDELGKFAENGIKPYANISFVRE